MKTITKEELAKILRLHGLWLDCDASGVKADLSFANLNHTDLSNTDLVGANLVGADLSGANLSGADLVGTDLVDANLSGADLSDANLSGANLSGADLVGTVLVDANLSGADLSGAITDNRYIQIGCIGSAKRMTTYCYDDDTIWCGCFTGTLDEFEKQVNITHANNPQYLAEYIGFVEYLKKLKGE